jgi:hypothetical protein
MIGEVTVSEIMKKYMVSCTGKGETGWEKHILLNDGEKHYSGRLYWDSHDGYECHWDGAIPPEADRPEFEYTLDCITEGDK